MPAYAYFKMQEGWVMKSGAVNLNGVVARLRKLSNPENVKGMARFGISASNTLGVPMPLLRALAREIGKDHFLAVGLWDTGIHEARILAGLIDDPELVTEAQMEKWAAEFDSWDICDQVCSNLFDRTPFAVVKAKGWSKREEEFVKRAAFVLMAALAVHDKEAKDELFVSFLRIVAREATDERNFVRKAVNWSLRQIGKRNRTLNRAALETAAAIYRKSSKTARWIASDAIRELRGEVVSRKLRRGR
jgi:3-methyladenine DNA glycosylase AlkD